MADDRSPRDDDAVPTAEEVFGRDPDIPEVVMTAAMSFDGYAWAGSLEALADICDPIEQQWMASGDLPDDVDLLRACLFLAVRRQRFTWGNADHVEAWTTTLHDRISPVSRDS